MQFPFGFSEKPDHDDLIREIEDDPIAQIVWSLPAVAAKMRRGVANLFSRTAPKPQKTQNAECA